MTVICFAFRSYNVGKLENRTFLKKSKMKYKTKQHIRLKIIMARNSKYKQKFSPNYVFLLLKHKHI